MAQRKRNTSIQHSPVYGAFRKALEALGPDWRRDAGAPDMPGVGSRVCTACLVSRLTINIKPGRHTAGVCEKETRGVA